MGSEEQHWACAECARKCSEIHGRMSPPSHLCFFKVMIKQFKEYLILPPKFARLLGKLAGQSIHLENSNGHFWEVKLLKADDHLAFQQGWNEFVSFHSIQEGEFLVFKYAGASSFGVQIFGTSGCERSHFSENIDIDIHKRCPIDCLCSHEDGRKHDTCKACYGIGDKVSSKKNKSIRTMPCESVSPLHLHCKTDGDFHRRKRPVECLCMHPHKDGKKHDNSHCCTKDSDSARIRKAIRTTPCEILSASICAAKDVEEDSNIPPKSSSHNMNNICGLQTATAVGYPEVPCTAVTDDADKGTEESQIAHSDVYANLNLDPVSKDAKREEEGSQMASDHVCVSVIVSQEDLPELSCKLIKTDSSKEQEMILALPSEFIPAKGGIEIADKSMIVEERSPYCANCVMSQTSCSKKLEANKYDLPTAENKVSITNSHSDIGISPTDCVEIPLRAEINSSNGLGCKDLVIELSKTGVSNEKVVPEEDGPEAENVDVSDKAARANDYVNSESMASLKCSGDIETDSSKELCSKNLVTGLPKSNENVVLEEDKFATAKDNIFDKETMANNFVSSQMPSLKCSGNGGNPSACDMAVQRFLVNEQGTCYIAQNSTGNVGLNSSSTNLSKKDTDDAKCKVSFAPTTKEIFGQSPGETVLADTINNSYHAQDGQLDTVAGDGSQQMSKMPKSQGGSNMMNGSSEHGVKQDAMSQEKVEKLKPHLKEADLKAVKAEILEPDELPSPNSSYFSFSLVVNTLSWHELFVPLPLSWGKRRIEKKVVLLRDPEMRVWPVLYHENLKFIGFLGGWEAFVAGNNIRKGDTCRFGTSSDVDSMLQVQISRAPTG